MQLLIPTYGRVGKQHTYQQLVRAGLKEQVKLVVQYREKSLYDNFPIIVLPQHIQAVAPTRQWLLENTDDPAFIMLDDDLSFYMRRADAPTKFTDINDAGLRALMESIEDNLVCNPHVGVAGREGANRNTENVLYNTRIMRVLAYDRATLLQHSIRFDGHEFMQDFHVNLSLLELGYPNCLLNWAVQNQAGSNAVGGCSTYRTPEKLKAAAIHLKETHPNFVTLVEKTTKTWKGMETRTDVRVQWKAAYEHGKRAR